MVMSLARPVMRPVALRATSLVGRRVAAPSNGVKVAAWFKFGANGDNAEDAGIMGSQGRDEIVEEDVEFYFNYMGMLAVVGSYEPMEKLIASGMHPCDIIFLWACMEGDYPKVVELLEAGADINVKDLDGKGPLELATRDDVKEVLEAAIAKA